jgi:predicted esterase
MVNVFRPFLIACLLGGASVSTAAGPALANQEGLVTLPGDLPEIANPSPGFKYDPNLTLEQFYVCVPPGAGGRKPFGVLAFINAGDEMGLPPGWKGVLAHQRLLYIAPQNVGNTRDVSIRAGTTVVAIAKMMELYKVDPKRVYVAGFSGGAKVACVVAYHHPDLVRGVLPICGFFHPRLRPEFGPQDKELLQKAREEVGFALITGPKDPNHANMLDACDKILEPEEYRATIFDVPGMGHEIPAAPTIRAAIAWLERGAAKPAVPPTVSGTDPPN